MLEDTYLGTWSRTELLPYVEPGVVLDNGYAIHLLRFATHGREARATLTIPDSSQAPAGGWHVAVNNPGTAGLDDACALGGTAAGAGLAGYFGARGLLGVAVDYPGLGTPGSHPYLVKEVEGTASLDAVRATLSWARSNSVPVSGRVVVAGLSQGGHATLAAAQLLPTYAPELDVRAFAVAAPASVFLEHWAAGVAIAGEHQVYHAMTVYAFNAFYAPHASDSALWVPEHVGNMDGLMNMFCPFASSGSTLGQVLGNDPAGIFNAGFLAAYEAASLDAYPAVQQGFAANRVVPFSNNVPLRIYQGTQDTTVPVESTRAMVDQLRQGGMDVDYVEVEGGEHTTVAFGFLAYPQVRTQDAITWLKEHLAR